VTEQLAPLTYLQRPPEIESDRPPLLALLHGVGSNEHDLFGLVPHLDPRFFIASFKAPFAIGPGANAWFAVDFTPAGPVHDPAMAAQSREAIVASLSRLVDEHGLDPAKVLLCGFSQGAIMSTYVALTRPEAVAGIAAMSGRVLPEATTERATDDRLLGLPVLWVHGTRDNVLPIRFGRDARAILAALPIDLTYEEFDMAHEVSRESLAAVTGWLSARLDP